MKYSKYSKTCVSQTFFYKVTSHRLCSILKFLQVAGLPLAAASHPEYTECQASCPQLVGNILSQGAPMTGAPVRVLAGSPTLEPTREGQFWLLHLDSYGVVCGRGKRRRYKYTQLKREHIFILFSFSSCVFLKSVSIKFL